MGREKNAEERASDGFRKRSPMLHDDGGEGRLMVDVDSFQSLVEISTRFCLAQCASFFFLRNFPFSQTKGRRSPRP